MNKVTLDELAKMFHNPEEFKKELFDLSVKLQRFSLLYGGAGMEALLQSLTVEEPTPPETEGKT